MLNVDTNLSTETHPILYGLSKANNHIAPDHVLTWAAQSSLEFCTWFTLSHYNDVRMSTMASQITSLTIVYSTVYSGADERKHQRSALLALVWRIFPAQRASNAENVPNWWRHHVCFVVVSRMSHETTLKIKLRSHMRGAVAERRRVDFDIPAPLPRVCSHIRGWTRSGRGRICHFLRTMMVWSARFRSGRGKLGVGPISCGAVFAPAPPPLRDLACVNACNDLCWSQFSARPRPRPPAHVWTYL